MYTDQTARQIFTLDDSIDVDSLKGVHILALVNIAAHLVGQVASKLQFWGRK